MRGSVTGCRAAQQLDLPTAGDEAEFDNARSSAEDVEPIEDKSLCGKVEEVDTGWAILDGEIHEAAIEDEHQVCGGHKEQLVVEVEKAGIFGDAELGKVDEGESIARLTVEFWEGLVVRDEAIVGTARDLDAAFLVLLVAVPQDARMHAVTCELTKHE